MINATKYLDFVTIFYLTQNRSTHVSLVQCFFQCLWDRSGNGKFEGCIHLIWMSFNVSISILKGITREKLIQFNTVNNFPVQSWVSFLWRAWIAAAELGWRCCLGDGLVLFINASSASLLSQCLSLAAVQGRSPYLQLPPSLLRLCRLDLQGRGCYDSEKQALELFICSQNRIICSWEPPGPTPCLSVPFSHEAAVHF